MDIRLIALDVDNTIVTPELELPDAVRWAVASAQERGVIVTLATGRMFASTRPLAESLNITAPLITYNGALVQDLAGNRYFEQLVSPKHAVELAEIAAAEGVTLNLYVDDTLYVAEWNADVDYYLTIAQVEPRVVGDLVDFARSLPQASGVLKALFVVAPGQRDELWTRLRRCYEGQLEVVTSNPRFIELTALGISKGRALAALAERLNIRPEQVMAAGDNFNDLTMVEYAGLGVAVGDAPPELKAVADVVVGTSREAGIADAIQRYVLK